MAFPSVYEMTNPLTTVRKQHFWEYFSGATLNSRWTQTNVTGTGTFAMSDEVNGGFKITAPSGGGNPTIAISFHGSSPVRQYAPDGSVYIVVAKASSTTSAIFKMGLKNVGNSDNFNLDSASVFNNHTNYSLRTGDGSNNTEADGSVPKDASWHIHKLVLGSSGVDLLIDGVQQVTNTTNLPDTDLLPQAQIVSTNSDAKSLSIRYMECYNT